MTMIASVLHMSRKDAKALRITDAYSIHRVVYSLYENVRDPEENKSNESSGILFADQGGDADGRRILMLSNRPPAEKVEGLYGRIESKEIPEKFLEHSDYRFKIIINPTRREKESGKLKPIRDRTAIADWFVAKAASNWGFEVSFENLQINKIDVLHFSDKNKNDVTISQAHVQGALKVTDTEKFQKSFIHGIGRARSFGCGLLQLVPIPLNPFS